MSGSYVNDGITLKYKVDDSTWATLGTTIGIDDSLDSIRYSTWTPEYEKEEKGKERIDNMNILELYERRKRAEIDNKYQSIIDEEYNNLDVVKEYKELISTFEINMKQLAEKYNTNDKRPVIFNGCENEYCYELNDYLKGDIQISHREEWNKERNELYAFIEEVKAVLSLSNDKDYQLDVLKNYEILDKKGRINI